MVISDWLQSCQPDLEYHIWTEDTTDNNKVSKQPLESLRTISKFVNKTLAVLVGISPTESQRHDACIVPLPTAPSRPWMDSI